MVADVSFKFRTRLVVLFHTNARIHSLPTAASMTASQAQVFSEALDYYLGEGKQYIPELYKLAHANTKEANDKILH